MFGDLELLEEDIVRNENREERKLDDFRDLGEDIQVEFEEEGVVESVLRESSSVDDLSEDQESRDENEDTEKEKELTEERVIDENVSGIATEIEFFISGG